MPDSLGNYGAKYLYRILTLIILIRYYLLFIMKSAAVREATVPL